ncbi:helix-turn-helix transcriptional regulator [Dyadobacter tibetensis]|uniref:helix-turn-helix transcriptional regulator n=1 Tax=Dyadobacter tibetensis TaxID=1211851 RepID=UPI00046EE4D9|nr:helix-turn-helix domain-containing protein [Dyadobacter tibetensis]
MKSTVLTFDQLPEAVYSLTCEVQKLRQLLEATNQVQSGEEFFDRKAAAKFLGVSDQTIYQLGEKLPRRKRFGKLVFLKSELEDYLINGSRKGVRNGK